MSIPLWILIIIGSIFGIVLTGGTVIGLIAVIIFKIYRKVRFGISLYEYTTIYAITYKRAKPTFFALQELLKQFLVV